MVEKLVEEIIQKKCYWSTSILTHPDLDKSVRILIAQPSILDLLRFL